VPLFAPSPSCCAPYPRLTHIATHSRWQGRLFFCSHRHPSILHIQHCYHPRPLEERASERSIPDPASARLDPASRAPHGHYPQALIARVRAIALLPNTELQRRIHRVLQASVTKLVDRRWRHTYPERPEASATDQHFVRLRQHNNSELDAAAQAIVDLEEESVLGRQLVARRVFSSINSLYLYSRPTTLVSHFQWLLSASR